MKLLKLLLTITTIYATFSCQKQENIPSHTTNYTPYQTFISPILQRSGDSEKGKNYLIYGDYIRKGNSYQDFLNQETPLNELSRVGDAANLPYDYNLVIVGDNKLATPNCLKCHAQYLNNKLIIGLGNSFYDNTNNPFIATDVVGTNGADKLAEVIGSLKNKNTLTTLSTPTYDFSGTAVPTDVPAWWLLKKKNAMYYAGWGQGDFSKLAMTGALVSLSDTIRAEIIDKNFVDVVAYIKSLTPPKYPQIIDHTLTMTGKKIFNNLCTTCHGTYETDKSSYPNLVISLDLSSVPTSKVSNPAIGVATKAVPKAVVE